jgi:hypothetical protein
MNDARWCNGQGVEAIVLDVAQDLIRLMDDRRHLVKHCRLYDGLTDTTQQTSSADHAADITCARGQDASSCHHAGPSS